MRITNRSFHRHSLIPGSDSKLSYLSNEIMASIAYGRYIAGNIGNSSTRFWPSELVYSSTVSENKIASERMYSGDLFFIKPSYIEPFELQLVLDRDRLVLFLLW